MAVSPIEYDLYYSEDKDTPLEHKNDAQAKALNEFKNMTILNTNLVFGEDSYFLHYLTQCVMAGKIPKALNGKNSRFAYTPIHIEDLSNVVNTAFSKLADATGNKYSVNGIQDVTLEQIINSLETACGKPNQSTKS